MSAAAIFAAGVAGLAALVLVTLILFACICRLQQLRDAGTLTPTLRVLGFGVILPIGYLFDVALNVAMSIVFLRLPQDWLLTGRLIRYKRAGVGWRARLATWLCEQLLDPLDPSGCHCKTTNSA